VDENAGVKGRQQRPQMPTQGEKAHLGEEDEYLKRRRNGETLV
jgi:hypothetical protein